MEKSFTVQILGILIIDYIITSYWLLVDCLVFTHFILPSLTFSNVAAGPALDELFVVALRARSHALPSRAGGDVTGH